MRAYLISSGITLAVAAALAPAARAEDCRLASIIETMTELSETGERCIAEALSGPEGPSCEAYDSRPSVDWVTCAEKAMADYERSIGTTAAEDVYGEVAGLWVAALSWQIDEGKRVLYWRIKGRE